MRNPESETIQLSEKGWKEKKKINNKKMNGAEKENW